MLKNLKQNWFIQSIKQKLKLYSGYLIFGISIILLMLSPTLSITWLFFTNIYLIYSNGFNSRDIVKVWVPTLTCWYFIFAQCMGGLVDHWVIIGENHTDQLIRVMLTNDIWFQNLCFQTVYLFHVLSIKLNTILYIPILPIISPRKIFKL